MNFVKYWKSLCEGQELPPDQNQPVEQQPEQGQQGVTQQNDQKQKNENESEEQGSVHFALAANIRNGLFKKDDSVYICQVGSTDQEGNKNSFIGLTEDDGDKMGWDNNSFEFHSYDPNKDNDWDYIENFAKCGSNAQILKTVKDHYGSRFRTFQIIEYYPKDANDIFVDHVDSKLMNGLCPYCR